MTHVQREDREGGVRVLRMTRGKGNAMDLELLRELREGLESLRDASIRAGVVTGAGSIFCAGVDLKRLLDGGPAYVREFLPALEAAFFAAFSCDKPLVAAVNGHAIAGGYVLANCCDRRLVADGGGCMGLPELHVGVPFPTLVMEILRATVAPPKLTELLLVGGTLPPREALAAGLIDDVVEPEDLLESACALASRLATLSPPAYAATKRKLREPAITAWRAKAADGDAAIVEQWCSADTLSAIDAFVKKTLR